MKICILKESLCLGGTERSAANISKALSKEHNVYMTVYDGSKTKYEYGGHLVDFNLPAQNGLFLKIKNNLARIYKYNKLIKLKDIELLFEFISINSPISALSRKKQIRIISARDFSVLSTCISRFNKCLKNADAMICNSEFLREYYISRYPEHKNKTYAVYNIIDVNDIIKQAKENTDIKFNDFIARHSKTIVSVGRFCKEKGFEYLLEAFAAARKENEYLGLVLIGDGDYKEKYLKIIEYFQISDHVYFTGFQKNPYKYMAKCSCFILSSLSEGFPNVLAEAMALNLPVIATNCYSGPAEILRNDNDYEAVTEKYVECDYGIITPKITKEDRVNALSQLTLAVNTLLKSSEKINHYAEMSGQRVKDFSEEVARKQLNLIFNELTQRR